MELLLRIWTVTSAAENSAVLAGIILVLFVIPELFKSRQNVLI
jgi:hypothetical protein